MNRNKKITIKDIAEKAKTSKTTVSFYLNGRFEKMSSDTKRRIKQVIDETGYSPNIMARSLKSKRSYLIGVIVTDISIPFSNNIVKGIDEVVRNKGYQIIIGSSNLKYEYEKKYIHRMLDMGVDGFIVQPTLKFNELVEIIQNKGKKLVFLDSVSENFSGKSVKTNNSYITYKAIKELAQKGYEEFILVTEDTNLLMSRLERKEGFIGALKDLNLKQSIVTIDEKTKDEELAKILKDKVNYKKKTVVFAINGIILQKVFKAIKIQGLSIPDPIGIIGFDNWDWTMYATPSVTTIEQPTYQEGKYAANMLIEMIEEDKGIYDSIVFDCNINWEQSTDFNISSNK